MNHYFGHGLAGLALLLLPMAALADEAKDKDKGKTNPPGAPLQAVLAAKKATYKLDLGGKSADEFKKALKAAEDSGAYPPAPAVDLVLELRNTSDKDIEVWVSGDPTQLMLELKGPGAVNVPLKRIAFTLEFRLPKAMTLAAGKGHKIEIKGLSYGHRGASHRSYWTEPGEYTLTASFKSAVAPAPKGAKDAGDGFGTVTVTSAPVKIKVEEK